MKRRLVVLGTGTDVGKTWIAATLARAARERGMTPLALKPIETGVDTANEQGSDAAVLADATASPTKSCYRFSPPVTPWIAAETTGETVDLARVATWIAEQEASATTLQDVSFTIIETAGGVFSPLNQVASNYELAMCLEPATWVLVAPNRLGVLHDVIATLEAMRARGRTPDLIVLNHLGAKGPSSLSNAPTLRRLQLGCPLLEASMNGAKVGIELLERLVQAPP